MKVEGLKICIACAYAGFFETGGAEKQALIIAKYLRDLGNDVFFISPFSENKIVNDDGFIIYCYKRHLRKIGFRYIPSLSRINNYLSRIDPDVIYQRGLNSQSFIYSQYSIKNRVKYLLGIAGDASVLDLKDVSLNPIETIERFLTKKALLSADNVICQTSDQLKLVKNKFGISSTLIRNISPKLSEDAKLSNIFLNLNEREKVVIVHCKYNYNKSPKAVIEIAKHSPYFKFEIAGIEKNNILLAKLGISCLDIPNNVTFIGVISHNEFMQKLRSSIAFINTSESEGFPNTFIEAWLARCLVISLNVDADGILSERRLGVFAGGKLENIIDTLEVLNNKPCKFSSVVIDANCFAQEMFNKDRNMKKIETLIGSC